MPVRVENIPVDFGPNASITRKCYHCKQVKDICCFKHSYASSKYSYIVILIYIDAQISLTNNRDQVNHKGIIF